MSSRAPRLALAVAELGAGRCLVALGELAPAMEWLQAAAEAASAAGVREPPVETEARHDLASLLVRLGSSSLVLVVDFQSR